MLDSIPYSTPEDLKYIKESLVSINGYYRYDALDVAFRIIAKDQIVIVDPDTGKALPKVPKTDDKGKIILINGKPVMVDDPDGYNPVILKGFLKLLFLINIFINFLIIHRMVNHEIFCFILFLISTQFIHASDRNDEILFSKSDHGNLLDRDANERYHDQFIDFKTTQNNLPYIKRNKSLFSNQYWLVNKKQDLWIGVLMGNM